MTEVLLNSHCPNCGSSFDPDFIFGNLRLCSACRQWSVALGNNTFNENVSFRIIHFEVDQQQVLNDLRTYLQEDCSVGFLKKISDVSIEKFLIPVREIGSGDNRKIIPLNSKYSDLIVDLLYNTTNNSKKHNSTPNGVIYDEFIPRDKQKRFSSEDTRNKTIVTEEIDISKESIDSDYNLFRDDYYRIVYIPVYRIHLGGIDQTWSCYGLKGVYGLKSSKSFLAIEKGKEEEKKESKALLIAFIGAIIGFFSGIQSCSSIINGRGDGFLLLLKGLFSFILMTVVGYVIGLIIGNIAFRQWLNYNKSKQLRRIFNQ